MTPSITLLLYVLIFWTLPASCAAVIYQRSDFSLQRLTARIARSVMRTLKHVRKEAAPARIES